MQRTTNKSASQKKRIQEEANRVTAMLLEGLESPPQPSVGDLPPLRDSSPSSECSRDVSLMQQSPSRETKLPTHGAHQSPPLSPLRQSPTRSLIDISSPSHMSPRASSSLHQSPIASPLPRISSRPSQNFSWRSTSPQNTPMRNLPPFQLPNVHSTPIPQVPQRMARNTIQGYAQQDGQEF